MPTAEDLDIRWPREGPGAIDGAREEPDPWFDNGEIGFFGASVEEAENGDETGG